MGMENLQPTKPQEKPEEQQIAKPEIISPKKSQEKIKRPTLRQRYERTFGTEESKRLAISGYLHITRRGDGYVSTLKYGDVFISAENLKTAFPGDYVTLVDKKPKKRAGRKAPEGIIAEVKPTRELFVGDLREVKMAGGNTEFILSPENVHRDVSFILSGNVPRNLKESDKIVVRFISWDGSSDKMPRVEFVKRLGKSGEFRAERDAIPYAYGFSTEFPKEVLDEANEIAQTQRDISPEERAQRTDMTDKPFITIDPHNAGDIDDALYVEKQKNGNFKVHVAIADVAHYVQPGSAIEREAEKRGTSVYFPHEVLHMLPPVLSKDLCSLVPNEERRASLYTVEINAKGKIVTPMTFEKAIIKSARKFTYAEAQRLLDKEIERIQNEKDHEFGNLFRRLVFGEESTQGAAKPNAEMLRAAWNAARALKRHRLNTFGSVELGSDVESTYTYQKGELVSVKAKTLQDTNSLIEEFALVSNWGSGEKISQKYAGNNKLSMAIFRGHDMPDPQKMQKLKKQLEKLGLTKAARTIPKKGEMDAHAMRRLQREIDESSAEEMVRVQIIRAMNKARYTPKPEPHFSLGIPRYAQVTSPIRRIGDIFNTRALEKKTPLLREDMDRNLLISQRATERSRAADRAQEEMEKLVNADFVSKQKERTKVRKGQITDVQPGKIEVMDLDTGIEGVVYFKGEEWKFDGQNWLLANQKTGEQYTIGDKLNVSVKNTNIARRHIEWQLVTT